MFPTVSTSLLSVADLELEKGAAEAALPLVVMVVHGTYSRSGALGYVLLPEVRYQNLPARVQPAGFPFVLGSESPVLTAYHLLYVSKDYEIQLSDYVYLGGLTGPSFVSLGQVDYGGERALNTYLLKRVNVYFEEVAA